MNKKFTIFFIACTVWAITSAARAQTEIYPIGINGSAVTSWNAGDLTSWLNSIPDSYATGDISYDHDTKTLTFKNATLTNSGMHPCISSSLDGLVIELIGNNRIERTTNESALAIIFNRYRNGTIKGAKGSKLTVAGGYGIQPDQCNLTVTGGCELVVSANYSAISGDRYYTNVTVSGGSTVKATGRGRASFEMINSLVLEDGATIIQPAGAAYDSNLKGVALNGKLVNSEVIITTPPPTTYDLYIAGTQVTSANKDKITGTGISGLVKYNNNTKTLTLDGAKINSSAYCIESKIEGLSLNIIGTNLLTGTGGYSCIKLNAASATIAGSSNAKLQINSKSIGVYQYNCNLTIAGGCEVIANSANYGICGQNGNNEVLTVSGGSTIKATGASAGSIRDLKSLVLEDGATIVQPAGANFSPQAKAVVNANNEIIKTEVVISSQAGTKYNLWIAGAQVTAANASNITAAINDATVASGSISYKPDTKTLTLKGAKIKSIQDCILSEIEGLIIKLEGDNVLNSTGNNSCLLLVDVSTTISGGSTAKLQATAADHGCIFYRVGNLTITGGCEVVAKGAAFGIWGFSTEALTISGGSTVKATGTSMGSIFGMKSLVINNGTILQPAGAVFEATKGVTLNGNVVKTEVIIKGGGTGLALNTAIKTEIYPNPAREFFTVTCAEPMELIELIALSGQVALSQATSGTTTRITVSELPRTAYIVKIYTRAGLVTEKLITVP